MDGTEQRAALARLIEERGADFAGLSRLIGRNAAYIQQFIKRGVPRKLDEQDRKLLAQFFGVDERVLGGSVSAAAGRSHDLVYVPKLDVAASAGAGSEGGSEAVVSHVAFDPKWLRQVCRGRIADLTLITVEGDSMYPTLADGDDILVDRTDGADRTRDGIYALRRDNLLTVKRLSINLSARTVTIISDNEAYPSWPDCELASVDIIGRGVWAGRILR